MSSRSPPEAKRTPPPTHIDITRASPPSNKSQPHPQTPPRSTYLSLDVQDHAHLGPWGGEAEATPGSWSTAATPGTGQPAVEWEKGSPTRATAGGGDLKAGYKPRRDSGSSTASAGSGGNGGVPKKAWVSEELEPPAANPYYISQNNGGTSHNTPESGSTGGTDVSKKSVRFTPSVVGGMSSHGSTPQVSPVQDGQGYPDVSAGWPVDPSVPVGYGNLPSHLPQGNVRVDMTLPPGFVPDSSDWAAGLPPAPHVSSPSPPHQPANPYYSPQPPQPPYVSAPQPARGENIYASAPPVELELSPSIIAKAQKHCRFAISALDYEDATQARKELRAALAVLGG